MRRREKHCKAFEPFVIAGTTQRDTLFHPKRELGIRLGGDVDIYDTALCTLMLEVYYRYLPASDLKKSGTSSGLMER